MRIAPEQRRELDRSEMVLGHSESSLNGETIFTFRWVSVLHISNAIRNLDPEMKKDEVPMRHKNIIYWDMEVVSAREEMC